MRLKASPPSRAQLRLVSGPERGSRNHTLALRAVTSVNLGNIDQTFGDAVAVSNFQNVDASALSSGVSITGSVGANTIIGGSGNDSIDGAGGSDVINAGAGNDTVMFHGTETAIDGGADLDTLTVAVGAAVTAVNFAVTAGLDQTFGDSAKVANFENLNAALARLILRRTTEPARTTAQTAHASALPMIPLPTLGSV